MAARDDAEHETLGTVLASARFVVEVSFPRPAGITTVSCFRIEREREKNPFSASSGRPRRHGLSFLLAFCRLPSQNSQDVFVPEDGVNEAAAAVRFASSLSRGGFCWLAGAVKQAGPIRPLTATRLLGRPCRQIRKLMREKTYSTKSWKSHLLHPKAANEHTVDWLGAGGWRLRRNVKLPVRKGVPITSPATWVSAGATEEFFKDFFRADEGCEEEIPLYAERVAGMRQAGRGLCDTFGGSFVNCVLEAGGSAARLVELVVQEFPSFRDEVRFLGRDDPGFGHLGLLRQSFVRHLPRHCENNGFRGLPGAAGNEKEARSSWRFDCNDRFTLIIAVFLFPSFRQTRVTVPRKALVHFGALRYSSSLLAFLKSGVLLEPGDRREIEIRANTIWAVEMIRRAVVRQQCAEGDNTEEVNAILLDFFIWDFAKNPENAQQMEAIPIHRTRSVYY
ncbi:MAG: hypothetical protein BJ554DRAFT_2038 [Olpidium bornovanus]|uniref:Queuosine 5'-phosphate N-glycosylase/hydrolase n=1 Tax=Olpidium bornovanus TaxID=278681 RepID=A0A8H8DGR2_9FUNG|nr:MAG: hypothetical protein BJ554DRAFT_2038 [Olpidium bornovanus]